MFLLQVDSGFAPDANNLAWDARLAPLICGALSDLYLKWGAFVAVNALSKGLSRRKLAIRDRASPSFAGVRFHAKRGRRHVEALSKFHVEPIASTWRALSDINNKSNF